MKKGVIILSFLLLYHLSLASFAKGFTVGSPVFEPDALIPEKYTCKGADISPALFWQNPPANTQSFVLIVDDPDAPDRSWVHWVLFNIPRDARNLTEGEIPMGTQSGKNSWGTIGYKGPCPPPSQIHRYFFKLYALDTVLPLNAYATKEEVVKAMQYHVIGMSEFSSIYHKD